MVYYFRLSEQEKRIQKLLEGANLNTETIVLYPESSRILKDFEFNPFSDFFPVEKRTLNGVINNFNSIAEAMQAYIDGEADTINAVIYGV